MTTLFLENETLPFCEDNILRGFSCYGISAPHNLTLLARVSSPTKVLLLQQQFVKQMEVGNYTFNHQTVSVIYR